LHNRLKDDRILKVDKKRAILQNTDRSNFMKVKFNKKSIFQSMLISVLMFTVLSFGQETNQGQLEQQQDEKEVVAVIDGDEVYMEELDQMINLQQTMIQIQQQNPQFVSFLFNSPEGQDFIEAFKRSQLEGLIIKKLLEREVGRESINLTQEDKDRYFNEQVEMIKQQQNMSDEDLLNDLNNQGIGSMVEFKEMFLQQQSENLKIRKLIETVVLDEVEVSDQEAKEFYNQGEYRMEFEEIKDRIKQELAQQKYIDQLREKADIDIVLDK
jgi:hypothetical protein